MLRGGLEQRRQEHVERAEADAQPVQRLAVGLLEVGDRRRAPPCAAATPPASASMAASARTPASWPDRSAAAAERLSGREMARDLRVEPAFEPRAQRGAARAPTGGRARGRCAAPARAASGRARAGRGHGPPSRRPAPPPSSTTSAKRVVGRLDQRVARGGRARRRAGARRRRAAGACRRAGPTDRPGTRSRSSWPIGSGPTLTSPSASTVTGSASAPRAPMSRTSTAVRRSTKRWVSRSCSASDSRSSTSRVRSAHLGRLLQPVGAVGDIGPAADPGEAVGERLDVALDIVEPRDLGGEPFVRDVAALADVAEQAADHAGVVHRARPCGSRAGRRPPTAAAPAPPRLRARSPGSSASSLSTARSIASGAARSSGSSRFASRLAISASTSVKSSSALRQ